MSEHMSPIPSRIYNSAVDGHVCGPEDVDFGQKVVHLIKYDRSGNEVSFESQVTQANKIYIIHDDFVLSSNITIPANCVLEFDGGSIDGAYIVTGNNTVIKAGIVKIFNTNVTLAGTWNVVEAYPEWFGAKGDGATDDRVPIQKTIDNFDDIKILGKTYLIGVGSNGYGLVIPSFKKISGIAKVDWAAPRQSVFITKSTDSYDAVLRLNGRNIIIDHLDIIGDSSTWNCDYIIEASKDVPDTDGIWSPFLTLQYVSCYIAKKACYHLHTFESRFTSLVGQHSKENGMVMYSSVEESRGPANIIIGCYMLNCRKEAYKFDRVGYSSMICCVGEHSGWNKSDLTDTTYYPVFDLYQCSSLGLYNCGCESCTSETLKLTECENINITGFKNWSQYYKSVNNDIVIDTCLAINIVGAILGAAHSIGDMIIEAKGETKNVSIENSMYQTSNGNRYSITDENIYKHINEGVSSVGVRNLQISMFPNEIAWDGLINRKSETTSKVPIIANVDNSPSVTLSSSNNTLKNIDGKLTIKPVADSFIPLVIYAQKDIPLVIENCNEIIFVNIGFGAVYSTSLTPNYLFNIKNSKVIFKNCRFDKDRNVAVAMMKIENSEVIIDNCFYNNLATPGLPYCTYDSVSKIQFITPKSGTTRPLLFISTSIGQEFFDTTLGTSGKIIYASSVSNNGTVVWVDATGTPV